MKPLTIGQLAQAVGLARGSLLHYEALGLLRPAARSAAGYRLYGDADVERVRAIRRYRDAGLPLAAIAALLDAPASGPRAAVLLEQRLLALSDEVDCLRAQQQRLARLLASTAFRSGPQVADKAGWVALLRRAGFSDADMQRWHADFEAADAAQHAAFLRALGLSRAEVAAMRRQAPQPKAARSGVTRPASTAR
jgi:MerR family transcriptional regulator, thiopeptide resistance regulator